MATPHTAPAPQGTGSVTPERDRLLALINANWSTQVIAAAIDLGLPDAMAAGRCDPQSLADASAAHPPSLLRLLRAMASLALCTEDDGGNFHLTAAGAMLRSDSPASLSAWAALNGAQMWTQ